MRHCLPATPSPGLISADPMEDLFRKIQSAGMSFAAYLAHIFDVRKSTARKELVIKEKGSRDVVLFQCKGFSFSRHLSVVFAT